MTDDEWGRGPTGRPLLMERLRRLGAPVGILLAALLVVFLSYQGPLLGAAAAFVATILIVVWLRNRPTEDERRSYGPGADDRMGRSE